MQNKEDLRKELQAEMEELKKQNLIPQSEVRHKIIMWLIRNSIAAGLIWYFWDHPWMTYALWIIIPLSLLSLGLTLSFNTLVSRKLERTQRKIDQLRD